MAKVRQDAWSHEDDLLLAETVLRHIREGSTQLNAFEEVGDKLNRTSAACGFRWNAEVRNKYINAIDLAKRQRKEMKRKQAKQNFTPVPKQTIPSKETIAVKTTADEITFDMVLAFLNEIKQDYYVSNQSKATTEAALTENEQLKEEVAKLEKQLKQTEKQLETMQEDYQTFIQIMDRARRMTVLKDERSFTSPSFRMDKNGNLEQLANPSSN
ncbi:RsfA family transcriptional regulator [Oceanobacillus alkalisoli]|uniref:RsfA family transcriptional regulator n=1 Tax=Oceanobacillus alkalisoli TaxID=2925113 RepID=UPI001EEF9083|nr:RsfA family transcriptional regulator [Oceanobacillus alkalisoli]MCF3941856.1 RsfA family transcriptional regulator [Oceanobacillus alkalisoli]MCG5103136.1 RsfA family transcriptional regulator [Oceanobacillus alkalisoli]